MSGVVALQGRVVLSQRLYDAKTECFLVESSYPKCETCDKSNLQAARKEKILCELRGDKRPFL